MPSNSKRLSYKKFVQGRIAGFRSDRYSYLTHWRELASYFLPRRYKWVISPNQSSRGSPVNQQIIDSSGVLAARNLAAGLMSGKTSPISPWFSLAIPGTDLAQTSPVAIWLHACEGILGRVFQASNFYNSIAQWYYDLVIFGTASLIIYSDFENVINCFNPCAGEFYVGLDGKFRPRTLYREFTMTISAVVDEFRIENCSESIRKIYKDGNGSGLSTEIVIAHAIEPNDDGRDFVDSRWAFRECFWEWSASGSSQTASSSDDFLRITGYNEQPHATCRWDIVSNDAYGRSVAMDAEGDNKQLQLESRRKAQAIDKMVNPPLIADMRLKNQPASTLPGGVTYVEGMTANGGKAGMASIYDTNFPVGEITKDLEEIRERLKYTFYNHLFQPISQYETRSNVTAVEIAQRKAESLIMLGPVFERIDNEGLTPIIERTFAICARAGIFPPPPPEIAGMEIEVKFVSMLATAQDATQAAAVQEVLAMAGQLLGVDPQIGDCVDFDFAIDLFSSLKKNDPRMMRSPDAIAVLRQQRAQQQQQAQEADIAQKLSVGAGNLAKSGLIQPGGGQ